jgi:hypothetical protein
MKLYDGIMVFKYITMLNERTQEHRTFLECRLVGKIRIIQIEMLTELVVNSYRFCGYTTATWQIGLSWCKAVTGSPKFQRVYGSWKKRVCCMFSN